MRPSTLSPIAVLALCAGTTSAAVIDFETTALGGLPIDNANALGTFFDGPTGVNFGFDTDGDLVVDAPAHFEHRSNGFDVPYAAYTSGSSTLPILADADLTPGNIGGEWLLREPKQAETPSASVFAGGDWFIIDYSGVLPTSCSGEIWDVDNGEQYVVNAYDSSNVLIAQFIPPVGLHPDLPGSRNGMDTVFVFSGLSSPIAKIGIYLQSTIGGGGFAFDNFNATQIPAPGAVMVLGMTGVVGTRRRR